MNIDHVYYNKKITTLNPRQPEVSALGVAKGRIVAVGMSFNLPKEGCPV